MEILKIVLAGVIGSMAMVLVLEAIHRLKWADANMLQAIGSWVTRRKEDAVFPGLLIHLFFGVFFAMLYSCMIALSPVRMAGGILILALSLGAFHGMVVSLLLNVMVAEHHPLARFRREGWGVVLSYLVAHMFYGAAVGLSLIALKTNFGSPALELSSSDLKNFAGSMIYLGWILLFLSPLVFLAIVGVYEMAVSGEKSSQASLQTTLQKSEAIDLSQPGHRLIESEQEAGVALKKNPQPPLPLDSRWVS